MATVTEALNIGWQRHQAGDLKAAESIYRQVLTVASENANAWCFLGMTCHDQGRYEEAVEAYERALEIQPQFPVALSNLGNTLKQQGKLEEAIASCRKAIDIKPDYSTAHNNLGVALVAQGQLEKASDAFEQALKLMPDDAVANANLGAALVRQGRFEEGTSRSQRALSLNPHYAEAHKNQAIVWLLLGDFERGWPEYEWRLRCPGSLLPEMSQPIWDGKASLAGKTLLIHAEQGLGDTIQFIRYATLLQEAGARVVAAVQKPLLRILQRCAGVDQWVATGEALPDHDYYAPLLSLPGMLGTRLETIPANIPYLRADPALSTKWAERLSAFEGLKIGIAWQGSPDFHADHHRSIPLSLFEPFTGIEGVTLFSLQKGHGCEQLEELPDTMEVVDYGDEMDEEAGAFMDTAAIMQSLDLVITSDTSVPHLSGALGVPTWLALSASPDWRWLLDRADNPWYPTMRLFRQQQVGDWEPVFAQLLRELEAVASGSDELPSHAAASTFVEPNQPANAFESFNTVRTCRHGQMIFNQHDMYIGKSLELYGQFSEGEVRLFEQVLDAGDCVVEAGANIGAHTVPLSKLVGPDGKVLCFEPQRIIFQTLCANLALNSLTNVEAHHAAVGESAGEIIVPLLDVHQVNNFGGLGLGNFSDGEAVPVMRLDDFKLEHCKLLKIDVEGMESRVVAGATETIAQHRPLLYVENDREEHAQTLIEQIRALEYRLYWHRPPLFEPDNYRGNTENIFGKIVSLNMLGVPKESDFSIDGLDLVDD